MHPPMLGHLFLKQNTNSFPKIESRLYVLQVRKYGLRRVGSVFYQRRHSVKEKLNLDREQAVLVFLGLS